MATLEDFLANKPLTPRMQRLMRGEDDEEAEARSPEPEARSYADGTPITNSDREHLRRMLGTAGWGVLLKLLDTALASREDAARRISLAPATSKDDIVAAWGEVAAAKRAREALVGLAEAEVEKLKVQKPPKQKLGGAIV